MALVEPRLIDSLVRPTYPVPSTVKVINSLDQDMETILRNTALSDDEKVRQYQRTLERYLTFHNQYHQGQLPLTTTNSGSSTTTTSTTPRKTNRLEDGDILESIPRTLRRKASLLLQRVKQSDSLGWNDRGELTVDGKAIPNSNMIDLMNDALRERQHFQPTGRAVFAQGLKAMNIPRDWVRNKTWWDEAEKVKEEERQSALKAWVREKLDTPTPRAKTPKTVTEKPSKWYQEWVREKLTTPSPRGKWWNEAKSDKDEERPSPFQEWVRDKLDTPSPDVKTTPITTTPRRFRSRQQRRPGLRPTSTIVPPQKWSPY